MLETGEIIKIPEGNFVVIDVEGHIVRIRQEQEADMWCREGSPLPLNPFTEVRILI